MEYINYSNKLFVVKRKIKEYHLKSNIDLTPLKILWHCDTMFRAQGFLWLCNEVKDVNYEEITE